MTEGSTNVSVLVGIGSNLGDRRRNIADGLRLLDEAPGVRVVTVSSLRETAPAGGPPQGRFLNAAAEAHTRLAPLEFLDVLAGIEAALGRERTVKNGPRTLDLDILLFGDLTIHEPRLSVPHPRMLERAFVLQPLAEIAPDRIHVGTGRTLFDQWLQLTKKTESRGVDSGSGGQAIEGLS